MSAIAIWREQQLNEVAGVNQAVTLAMTETGAAAAAELAAQMARTADAT